MEGSIFTSADGKNLIDVSLVFIGISLGHFLFENIGVLILSGKFDILRTTMLD